MYEPFWHSTCNYNALFSTVTIDFTSILADHTFVQRLLSNELDLWLADPERRPLVVRGARQVGKTWLIRDLAERNLLELIEVNFERDPDYARVFDRDSPLEVFNELCLLVGKFVEPGASLLFIDEIQAAPAVLAKLRWFAEELPELPVVAAGSLLEFALTTQGFSMPVGRITYRHVEPLCFDEYLRAHSQNHLLSRLASWSPGTELGPLSHSKATEWYERYSMVGGMPAVVHADVEHSDPARCRRLQTDLMATYRDDFAKYAGRMEPHLLDLVLVSVAAQLGGKFVYARAGEGVKERQTKYSLQLLAKSRLITLAPHSTADGIPLAGAVDERKRKALLLDVGLIHALLRTPAARVFPRAAELAASIRGKLAEQLAGQQLRVLKPGSGDEPTLHYWQRGGGRPGELDFVVEIDQTVVPVELKAGASGSMKSLHQFMHDKRLDLALRIDTNPPSVMDVDVKTTRGQRASYRLLSLPGYLLWRAGDLVSATLG